MGRYVNIAKRAIEAGQTVHQESDPYAERMQAALHEINLPAYPAGMLSWLDTAHPELYVALTSNLPDEIQRLWSEHAPFEQFEGALERLVSAHKRGCGLYREYRNEQRRREEHRSRRDQSEESPSSFQKTSQRDFRTAVKDGGAK